MIKDILSGNVFVQVLRSAILVVMFLCCIMVTLVTAVSPEILEAALPTASDVTPGLDMINPPGITGKSEFSQNFHLQYGWEGYFRLTCPKKSGQIYSNPGDWFQCRIWAYSRTNAPSTLGTPEIWKNWIKGLAEPYTDYPNLPDSVWYRVIGTPSETTYRVEEEIAFWVDPNTYIQVEVSGVVNIWSEYDELGCSPSVAERKNNMEVLVDSETERIARIVRKNLLGEEEPVQVSRDYGELIWILQYYSPDLFEKYSDQVIYQALVINETGILGPDRGITYALKDNMMYDIQSFKKMLSEPVPPRTTRLLDPISGKNILAEDLEKAADIVSVADSYLKVADAFLGYETDNPINFGPLVDLLTFYHDLEKKMKYARDEIVIPDFAGDMYQEYKKGRSEKFTPEEAFDRALYEATSTTEYLMGKGWYAIRSYGSFGEIKDDSIVEQMVMERFEARYHEEELVDLHALWLEYEDIFIKGIMWQYHEKLYLLAHTCQAISDGKIHSDVIYTPQRWDILPPELIN